MLCLVPMEKEGEEKRRKVYEFRGKLLFISLRLIIFFTFSSQTKQRKRNFLKFFFRYQTNHEFHWLWTSAPLGLLEWSRFLFPVVGPNYVGKKNKALLWLWNVYETRLYCRFTENQCLEIQKPEWTEKGSDGRSTGYLLWN